MNQSLHLLVVDPSTARVLTTWNSRTWLLPILRTPERLRPCQPAAEWAATIGVRARMIGQWLGRLSSDATSIDWLAVLQADARSSNVDGGGLCWQPTQRLVSCASLIEYQQWALTIARSQSGLPTVSGPFGTVSWLDEVRSWVEEVSSASVTAVLPFRATAYEVAVGFEVNDRRVFFKGLSADRAEPAKVAFELYEGAADVFPHVIAHCRRADGAIWWLTEACAGISLARQLSVANVERVSAACVDVQHAFCQRPTSAIGRLPRIDLLALAEWGRVFLRECGASELSRAHAHSLEDPSVALGLCSVPESLVHVDLDPSNVFLNGADVRFIDVDEMHYGPAPMMAALFAAKLARSTGDPVTSVGMRRAVYRAYQHAWRSSREWSALWPAFEVAADLFNAHLSWTRVEAKLRRGEIHGVAMLVRRRIVEALARALATHAKTSVT